ncbi:MAG: hypothetical protein ACE5R4_03530 [Armatimonadota bacterium]
MARKSRRKRRRKPQRPTAAPRQEALQRELAWTSWPCMRDRRVAVGIGALLVVLWALIYVVFNDLLLVVLSVLFLCGALLPFYTPTTYTLNSEYVESKGILWRTRREWKALRSCYANDKGALLSPFSRPSRLEGFRGISLRFEDNRDEVLEFIASHLPSAESRE